MMNIAHAYLEEVVDVGQPSSWLPGLAAGVEVPCKVEDSIAKKSSGMDGYLLDGYLSRGCGGALQGC